MSQFLLLREDAIAPLRVGISAYRRKQPLDDRQMQSACNLYTDVEMQSLRCATKGIEYRVSFSSIVQVDWQRTQRQPEYAGAA